MYLLTYLLTYLYTYLHKLYLLYFNNKNDLHNRLRLTHLDLMLPIDCDVCKFHSKKNWRTKQVILVLLDEATIATNWLIYNVNSGVS